MRKSKFFAIVCTIIIALTNNSNAQAQESGNWSMTVGADVTNQFLWRGLELSDAAVQPSVSFDYEKGDWALSIGAWGSKAFKSDDFNELDLSAELSWKNFTLSATNYSEYYGSEFDSHYLDLGLSWTLSEKIPLTVSWYSIVNKSWDKAFPSYLELSYALSVWEIDFNAAVGMLPFKSPDYYGNEEFSICNLNLSATHEFELNEKMTVPVSAQIMYNPDLKDLYWAVSAGYYFTLDF